MDLDETSQRLLAALEEAVPEIADVPMYRARKAVYELALIANEILDCLDEIAAEEQAQKDAS